MIKKLISATYFRPNLLSYSIGEDPAIKPPTISHRTR